MFSELTLSQFLLTVIFLVITVNLPLHVMCSGGPLDNMSIRACAIILKSFTEVQMLFSNSICF